MIQEPGAARHFQGIIALPNAFHPRITGPSLNGQPPVCVQ